jgi:hypothetical protein
MGTSTFKPFGHREGAPSTLTPRPRPKRGGSTPSRSTCHQISGVLRSLRGPTCQAGHWRRAPSFLCPSPCRQPYGTCLSVDWQISRQCWLGFRVGTPFRHHSLATSSLIFFVFWVASWHLTYSVSVYWAVVSSSCVCLHSAFLGQPFLI